MRVEIEISDEEADELLTEWVAEQWNRPMPYQELRNKLTARLANVVAASLVGEADT